MTKRETRTERLSALERAARMLRRGQVVVRLSDDALVRVIEVDLRRRRVLLEDGVWVDPDQVVDPLRASYRWDVEREQRRARREEALQEEDADGAGRKVFFTSLGVVVALELTSIVALLAYALMA